MTNDKFCIDFDTFNIFLFDLDGTLVDSSKAVYLAMKQWCDEHDIEIDNAIKLSMGRRIEDTITLLAPHLDASFEANQIQELESGYLDTVTPVNGAEKFISELLPYKWAVVTSSPLVFAESRLKHCNIQVPSVLISAEMVDRGKPHPEPFQRAIEKLDCTIENCLVFEDADSGVNSALKAGCKVVVIGPDCIIEDTNIVARIDDYSQLLERTMGHSRTYDIVYAVINSFKVGESWH